MVPVEAPDIVDGGRRSAQVVVHHGTVAGRIVFVIILPGLCRGIVAGAYPNVPGPKNILRCILGGNDGVTVLQAGICLEINETILIVGLSKKF